MSQLLEPRRGTTGIVSPGTPGLILAAVHQLMSHYRDVAFAASREEDVITQCDRPAAAQPQHQSPEPSGGSMTTDSIEPNPIPVYRHR